MFWLSNNRVCYIYGGWNQQTQESEFQHFSASATGKASYRLDEVKGDDAFFEIDITGLHYWDSYARACPQVRTLEIPVDRLDPKNPVILITEALRETTKTLRLVAEGFYIPWR